MFVIQQHVKLVSMPVKSWRPPVKVGEIGVVRAIDELDETLIAVHFPHQCGHFVMWIGAEDLEPATVQ